MDARPGRTVRSAAAASVSLVTALLFWPAVRYEWLRYWDDGAHLIWNEAYKGLSPSHLWWMLHPFLGQWMPLTWLSWAIDFKVWGLDPAAFHRENILLHAASAGLLVLVAWRVIRAAVPKATPGAITLAATLAALLWALHPLRVESVAWVNERRDVLCGFFYLLAILTYLLSVASRGTPEERSGIAPKAGLGSWTRGASAPGRPWYLLSILCFELAFCAKSLAVTLPVALVLLDVYPLRRRAFLEKIPYLVISVAGVLVAFVALAAFTPTPGFGVIQDLGKITLEDRALIVAYSVWFYFAKTVWPAALSPLYELTFRPLLWEWRYLGSLLAVSLATALAWRWRRAWPAWTVAWTAYAVAVIPISGAVQNGYQIAALRYSYLATLPLVLLAGGLFAAGLERARPIPRGLLVGLGTVAVASLAVVTAGYLPAFHDGVAFWTRAVRVEPSCVVCADMLVHQAVPLGQAQRELQAVVAAHPDLQEQRWELGMVAFMRAHGAEGEEHFKEYIRQAEARDPGYIVRIEADRQMHLALARHVLRGPASPSDVGAFYGVAHGFAAPR